MLHYRVPLSMVVLPQTLAGNHQFLAYGGELDMDTGYHVNTQHTV